MNDRKLLGSIHGMDYEDVAENRAASISMKHGCVLADRVFAKTLQTAPDPATPPKAANQWHG